MAPEIAVQTSVAVVLEAVAADVLIIAVDVWQYEQNREEGTAISPTVISFPLCWFPRPSSRDPLLLLLSNKRASESRGRDSCVMANKRRAFELRRRYHFILLKPSKENNKKHFLYSFN